MEHNLRLIMRLVEEQYMPTPRSKKNRSPKPARRKVLSTWKKTITAEAGRRLRAKSGQTPPDTSTIPWL